MANSNDTFTQRISLEGGEEILRQLERIGATAEKAIGDFKKAIEGANKPLDTLSKSSKAAQEALVGFGKVMGEVTQVIAPFSSNMTGLVGVFTRFGAIGAAGGIGAAIAGLALFTKSAAESINATRRQAEAFGLTVEQMRAIGKAAREAGIDQDALTTALGRFSRNLAEQGRKQQETLVEITQEIVRRLPTSSIRFLDPKQFEELRKVVDEVAPQLRAVLQNLADSGSQEAASLLKLGGSLDVLRQKTLEAALASEDFRTKLRSGLGRDNTPAFGLAEQLSVQLQKIKDETKGLQGPLIDAQGNIIGTFEAFKKFADQIRDTPDQSKKVALAVKELGRQLGPEFVAVLNKGGSAIDAYFNAIRQSGTVTEELSQKALALRQAQFGLDDAFKKFSNTIVSITAGPLTRFLQQITRVLEFVEKLRNFKFDFELFKDLGDAANQLNPVQRIIEEARKLLDTGLKKIGVDLGTLIPELFAKIAPEMQKSGTAAGQAFEIGLRAAIPGIGAVIDGIRLATRPKEGDLDLAKSLGLDKVPEGTGTANKEIQLFANSINNAEKGAVAFGASLDGISDKAKKATAAFGAFQQAASKPLAQQTDDEFNALFNTRAGGEIAGRDFLANPLAEALNSANQSINDTKRTLEGLGESGSVALKKTAEAATETATQFASINTGTANIATETDAIATGYEGVKTIVTDIGTEVDKVLQNTRELVSALQTASASVPSGGGDSASVGAARGGFIWGPGTETSDSILARLSRGEYVINAAAVRHWGVDFMRALNHMKLPKFAIGGMPAWPKLPKFNMGGLVHSMVQTLALPAPGFALGGSVSPAPARVRGAGSPITFNFPDGRRVSGTFSGSGSAMAELRRAAASGQVFSAGRRQSSVR